MDIISTSIIWLEKLATQIPLPLFVVVGSLVEDIIAPIPSPLVFTLAGSIAYSQQLSLLTMGFLLLLGAISKTIGAYMFYVIVDKAEDVMVGKFGKYLGLEEDTLERWGKSFGKGRRDDLIIFLSRAIPVIPTTPVSAIAGLLKLPLKGYLIATFAGIFFRNIAYLYIGYVGVETLGHWQTMLDNTESLVQKVMIAIVLGIGLVYLYSKRESIADKIRGK